ncbi:MAG: hypothetical protein QOG30_3118, partial [Acidimicrobiaceae bacterium]
TRGRRSPRAPRTGDAELDKELNTILDDLGVERDRDVLFEILVSAVRLAQDHADRLDLKITSATLKEMRAAFRAFAPYIDVPKVTIFGSARTLPTDPSYAQARDFAEHMASRGWMVVTGAGPGIMAAGLEGAGREHAFGVNIRLPFEQGANAFIAGDDKLISMKYFFTRKLMLMKESLGFVSLPGGFGTLDETMELLTLIQTGKAAPAPVVLLDEPGGTFWPAFARFLRDDTASRGLIDADDMDLILCTDDVHVAAEEVLGFYRNYQSIRWVGDQLVIRMNNGPSDEQLAQLTREFGEIAVDGGIERTAPLPAEVRDDDHLDLDRIALRYNGFAAGKLRRLINATNAFSRT